MIPRLPECRGPDSAARRGTPSGNRRPAFYGCCLQRLVHEPFHLLSGRWHRRPALSVTVL